MPSTDHSPLVVIAGARKSATDWVDACLREHPQIAQPQDVKELRFFDDHWDKGIRWYCAQFQPAPQDDGLHLETCPSYMANPHVHTRLHESFPSAKIIFMLRDPVERAWSDYKHSVKKGRLRRDATFSQALKRYPHIVSEGYYDRHVSRWLALFGHSRVRCYPTEWATSHPAAFYTHLCDWIGVSPFTPNSAREPFNTSTSPPRFRFTSALVYGAARRLRIAGVHRPVNLLKNTPLPRLLSEPNSRFERTVDADETCRRLARAYQEHVVCLSHELGYDIQQHWAWFG